MSKLVKPKWILTNKDKLVALGIANGIGVENGSVTKLYQYFLKNFMDQEHSFYYDAAIVHDTLYVCGNTDRDKKRADFLFFVQMMKTLKEKYTIWSNVKTVRYFLLAIFYYFVVTFFGRPFFNWGRKITKQEIVSMFETELEA